MWQKGKTAVLRIEWVWEKSLLRIQNPAHSFTSAERRKRYRFTWVKVWTHKYTSSSITKSKNICSSPSEECFIHIPPFQKLKTCQDFFSYWLNMHINDNVLSEQGQLGSEQWSTHLRKFRLSKFLFLCHHHPQHSIAFRETVRPKHKNVSSNIRHVWQKCSNFTSSTRANSKLISVWTVLWFMSTWAPSAENTSEQEKSKFISTS